MMGYRRPPSLRINATSQPSAENSEVLTLLRELSAKVDAIKAWQDDPTDSGFRKRPRGSRAVATGNRRQVRFEDMEGFRDY